MSNVIFDIPKMLRDEPSREMGKDELRAAVDILWDSLPNCYNMEDVDEQAWKEEHYKVMKTGTSYCGDSRLTYKPKNKSDG